VAPADGLYLVHGHDGGPLMLRQTQTRSHKIPTQTCPRAAVLTGSSSSSSRSGGYRRSRSHRKEGGRGDVTSGESKTRWRVVTRLRLGLKNSFCSCIVLIVTQWCENNHSYITRSHISHCTYRCTCTRGRHSIISDIRCLYCGRSAVTEELVSLELLNALHHG